MNLTFKQLNHLTGIFPLEMTQNNSGTSKQTEIHHGTDAWNLN